MTSYTDIFNIFLNKISDIELLELSDSDINEMLKRWMTSAIAKSKSCKSDFTDRDDETQFFTDDLLDIEKEMLAIGMVKEWLEQQLNSVTLTKQVFGGKEEKWFSQAAHLEQLQELSKKTEIEARKLARNYTFQSYLNENLS